MWLGCLGISSNESTDVLIFLFNLLEAHFPYSKYPNPLFQVSGMSGMVSVLIFLIVDSCSCKISKVLIGEYLCQGSHGKGVTMPHPQEEAGDLDRDRVLPTSMDHDLDFPDRSMGQNSIDSAKERGCSRFFPVGHREGTQRWQPSGLRFKRVNGGKLVEVLAIFPEEA